MRLLEKPSSKTNICRGQHRLDTGRVARHHTLAAAAGLPMAACSRIGSLSLGTLLCLCNLPHPNLPQPAPGSGLNPASTIQPAGA